MKTPTANTPATARPSLVRRMRDALLMQEDLNFLLTNRVPRIALTRFMGWFSRIEQPLVSRASIAVWKFFGDLELHDTVQRPFRSMRDCFTRELRPGARPVEAEPSILASPCDAIVGACGPMSGVNVFQAKGFPYSAAELFGDAQAIEPFRNGTFVTLRLRSGMYHRFHAPHDCEVQEVRYLSGDTWNVNPVALKRVERLFCRNERAVLQARLSASGHRIALVPVAAILVASMRLHCLDVLLHLKWKGPTRMPCNARYEKGQEMGWFEQGSTIIVFAPEGFALAEGIATGKRVQMGQALMRLPVEEAGQRGGAA
ncbi:archaetidylserine decarboxylase [Variovorax dokdonensis]|uniref:phosphatidylserine decarboxylase n=1 Tax=Variovorax dokdonensis TaxID=344883 RepID=A0ABT7ND90_9BURK|nr:archaetidylserine decarboxylase [Variovorax dokdonensis]MDM0045931.1 archaetidylserine decarboxylase [Variovorax dokdonensis]